MKFHHVRNLIVMNLMVMMDKVNGEIFPPMGRGRAPVFVAEGRKIQNRIAVIIHLVRHLYRLHMSGEL